MAEVVGCGIHYGKSGIVIAYPCLAGISVVAVVESHIRVGAVGGLFARHVVDEMRCVAVFPENGTAVAGQFSGNDSRRARHSRHERYGYEAKQEYISFHF